MSRNNIMPLPRREFLGRTAALGTLAACGTTFSALAQSDSLNAAKLKEHIGETFYLNGEESSFRVKLAGADAHATDRGRPGHVRPNPFSLIFHAPYGTKFNDQICSIQHPELGSVKAFVSEVDRPKRHVTLQVVFG